MFRCCRRNGPRADAQPDDAPPDEPPQPPNQNATPIVRNRNRFRQGNKKNEEGSVGFLSKIFSKRSAKTSAETSDVELGPVNLGNVREVPVEVHASDNVH